MNPIKTLLTDSQTKKADKDLQIIEKLTSKAKSMGVRVIVSGGYAVDGFLGEITRPHNDIDLQFYTTRDDALETVTELLNFEEFEIVEEERKEYYKYFIAKSGDTKLDISYLQTSVNPFGGEKFIIKSDGTVDEQKFELPIYGKINEIRFEIQDPQIELKDKIYKREVRGDIKRIEHEQDIKNLKKTPNLFFLSKSKEEAKNY